MNKACGSEAAQRVQELKRVGRGFTKSLFIFDLPLFHVWQTIKGKEKILPLHSSAEAAGCVNSFNPSPKQVRYSGEKWSRNASGTAHHVVGSMALWKGQATEVPCSLLSLHAQWALVVIEWSQRAKKLSARVSCDTKQTHKSFQWFSRKAGFKPVSHTGHSV